MQILTTSERGATDDGQIVPRPSSLILRSSSLVRRNAGFTILGLVIAIAILAAFGASMILMVATNQRTRSQVLYMDQAFGSVQAGFEFTLRQILVSGSTATSFIRNLKNGTIAITRTGGLIKVTVTQGTATAAYQITDPSPPP